MPGPPPKHPDDRVRRNKPPELQVIISEPVPQPDLPEVWQEWIEIVKSPSGTTQKVHRRKLKWSDMTRRWWAMWGSSPLTNDFTSNDWSSLLDTAVIYNAYWNGNLGLAGELRGREAKFGATPEDRARLRVTFATADRIDNERERSTPGSPSRSRRGPLKAL